MSIHIVDPSIVTTLTDNALQIIEARNDANRHGTRVWLSLSDEQLTSNALMVHYIHCGRAKVFREVHSPENYWGTGVAIGCDPSLLPLREREQALWRQFCLHNPEIESYDLDLIVAVQSLIWQSVHREIGR